jgi:hypothetical protein
MTTPTTLGVSEGQNRVFVLSDKIFDAVEIESEYDCQFDV